MSAMEQQQSPVTLQQQQAPSSTQQHDEEEEESSSPTNDEGSNGGGGGGGSDNEQDSNVTSGDHSRESVEELISNYKLVDLKNICRQLNLKVTGNKRPVAERIWNYYHNPQPDDEAVGGSGGGGGGAGGTGGSGTDFYQQAQQAQQVQHAQLLQQQQQQLMQLPPQQQQVIAAFHQQYMLLHQQINLLQQQGQPVPSQLQQMYIQYLQISQLPLAQLGNVLLQMQQTQLQYMMHQQQQQQQQQQQLSPHEQQQQQPSSSSGVMNGSSSSSSDYSSGGGGSSSNGDLKRPREETQQQQQDMYSEMASPTKRIKTSNPHESQVMKIIDALILERQHLTDNSQMIISMQSIECSKNHLTRVIEALLCAQMDHLQIVDCVAYVLYECLDKKVLNSFYSAYHQNNMTAPSTELYELRVFVSENTLNFIKKCIVEQGEQNYASSDSIIKLFDLMTWVSVLDYVTVGVVDGGAVVTTDETQRDFMRQYTACQKSIIEASSQLLSQNTELSQYIQQRYEVIQKIVTQDIGELSAGTDAINNFVQLLEQAKKYFDASALETFSLSASAACVNHSAWNLLINRIQSKNNEALNGLIQNIAVMDDETDNMRYDFWRQCNNSNEHWWAKKLIPDAAQKTEETSAATTTAALATENNNTAGEAMKHDSMEQQTPPSSDEAKQDAEAPAVKADDAVRPSEEATATTAKPEEQQQEPASESTNTPQEQSSDATTTAQE